MPSQMFDYDGNWITVPRVADMPDLQLVRLLQFPSITPGLIGTSEYQLPFDVIAGSVVLDAWFETNEAWDSNVTIDLYCAGGTIKLIDSAEVDTLSEEDGRVRLRNGTATAPPQNIGLHTFYLSTDAKLVIKASGASAGGVSNLLILMAEPSTIIVPVPEP